MGCSESKIKNEAVTRCEHRKLFIKQAVSGRNAFAAAHSSYATYLKSTGAALSDFIEGEININYSQSSSSVPPSISASQQPFHIPPPPPPHPHFSPLQRSVTMPEVTLNQTGSNSAEAIIEEDEQNSELESDSMIRGRTRIENENEGEEIHRKVFEEKHNEEKVVAPPVVVVVEGKGSIGKKKSVNLIEIFKEVDDHFLNAFESAHEVSKMLEAKRMHYHSNFADNKGHIDHSARVMQVITWNRSFGRMPNFDDGKYDFDLEDQETHATVLDKLLAWEKKLYDEVRAGELVKLEYQKKVALLNKLKKKGTNSLALQKAKAAVSHLHTRYIVDMQSLDSTISEINHLRDQVLYRRLAELVDGMATMWGIMQANHEKQSRILTLLRSVDISQSPAETIEHRHDRTYQLMIVVQEWQSQFQKLVNNQKAYIKALNSWLKLHHVPIEINLSEKVSLPRRVKSPPIQRFLHAWHDYLEKLPDELASTAITNFAAVIDTIIKQQQEEIVSKRKCDETRKELDCKTRQFQEWYNKYMQRKIQDKHDPHTQGNKKPDEVVTEKKFLVDQVKKRLDDEEEDYASLCLQVRQKSLGSLKNFLPKIFKAMSDFSLECSIMYSQLRSISQNQYYV